MLLQLGYTYTLIDAGKDIKSVAKALKKGRFKLVTKPLLLWVFIVVTANTIYKISCSPFRIIYRKLAGKI